MRAVGYVRVSTEEQGRSGAGLAAQRKAIRKAAEYHRWELVELFEDVASGKSTNGRPGLGAALDCLRSHGCADVLVVSKLDRLSRSVADFARMMETARKDGWSLVALDLGLDTTTPTGEMIANVMASLAQWERRLIGERTAAALATKRDQGVRLGRPAQVPADVRRAILRARKAGRSYRAIAETLNAKGTPTGQRGARWYASTVRAVELRTAG
jgi:DNA invertase Pin-like site-specific DNA recombinase